MKKIILTGILVAALGYAQAQQGYVGSAKTMTVEEANKLNPSPQTTINGKPYSQYKAEQDALKQQQASTNAQLNAKNNSALQAQFSKDAKQVAPAQSLNNTIVNNTSKDGSNSTGPVAQTKPAEVKSIERSQQQLQIQPAVNDSKTIEPAKTIVAAKTETLPAILKGTSVDPDARPVMPAAKDATVPVKKD